MVERLPSLWVQYPVPLKKQKKRGFGFFLLPSRQSRQASPVPTTNINPKDTNGIYGGKKKSTEKSASGREQGSSESIAQFAKPVIKDHSLADTLIYNHRGVRTAFRLSFSTYRRASFGPFTAGEEASVGSVWESGTRPPRHPHYQHPLSPRSQSRHTAAL